LQHNAVVDAVRVNEFPEEARLANTGLPYYGDHLTMPLADAVESVSHLLQLDAPADESGEPSWRGGLETGSGGTAANEFENLDRRSEPLDRHWAEGRDLDEVLGQLQRRAGEPRATGRRELFETGG
jgi:hypothetical protein